MPQRKLMQLLYHRFLLLLICIFFLQYDQTKQCVPLVDGKALINSLKSLETPSLSGETIALRQKPSHLNQDTFKTLFLPIVMKEVL
jgi:hypothetical protein